MINPKERRLKLIDADVSTASRGVNDNIPGVVAGHELSGMGDGPRPAAAEAVLHYARISEIASFPDTHPSVAMAAPPLVDGPVERSATSLRSAKARVSVCSVVSVIVHISLFVFLTAAAITLPDEEAIEEAGAVVSVTMLGESDLDSLSAGEVVPEPPAEPEVVEAVVPDAVQPTEVTPTETVTAETQPVEAPQPTPVEAVQAEPAPATETVAPTTQTVAPEAAVAVEPDIMTSSVPAEPTVAQAAVTQVPETVQDVKPQTVDAMTPPPEEIKPVEEKPVEVTPVEKPPVTKEVAEKKPAPKAKPKPKPVAEKKKPEKVRPKTGSGGESTQDQKKGSTEGRADSDLANNGSKAVGNTSASGSAAIANYRGKIQSKIARSVRSTVRGYKESATVVVRLTIVGSGSLSGVSVASSSGVPELDQAVVNAVRRAAPFPPLPPAWGKPSWTFTQPVQVTGR